MLARQSAKRYKSFMAARSHIEWTEMTWNPVTGCTKISPGCKHCYAETMSRRLKAMGTPGYENGFAVSLMPDRLDQPLYRKTPTMWFVNSMSDLFHPKVPFGYVEQVMERIEATPHHIYQILTKRPERMTKFFASRTLPSHVWLGVTVEDRKYGVPRIEALRDIDAYIRFLSVEPLLEDLGEVDFCDMDWVIVGGESGAKARPMQAEWVRRVKYQCERDNAAFFFKQWGAHGADGVRRAKSTNGRLLDGHQYEAMPKRWKLDKSVSVR